jgi:cell division protein FtsW (lipid II flippase)
VGITSKTLSGSSLKFDRSVELGHPAPIEKGLLLTLLTLFGIGLVQVYSASFIFAIESKDDGLFFFKKQLIFVAVAMLVVFLSANTPWKWIEKWGVFLWVLSAIGLILTFVPGVGYHAGGAARWLNFGPFKFEPSELLKISLSLLLAHFLGGHAFDNGKLDVAFKNLCGWRSNVITT